MSAHAVTFAEITQAHDRIVHHIHRTPVLTSRTLDAMSGRSLFFKCENMQRVGAFKFRGATNAVLGLDEAAASRGVCTHSSGNHAQALALAAKQRRYPGVDCHADDVASGEATSGGGVWRDGHPV